MERTRLRLRRKEGRKGIRNQNRKETNMKSRRNDVPCYPPGQIARGRTCRPAVILVPRRAANLRFSKDWRAHMSKTDGTRETMIMKRQTPLRRPARRRPASKTIVGRARPRCPARPRPAATLAIRRCGAPHRARSRGERAHTIGPQWIQRDPFEARPPVE